ncbi:hypothetical protein WDV06_10040 [Streptomyces racemochromogenes]|uniref:Uncharacterized protein n=1 Tax=Streptomyces racemochromogenes TaxID=67353 RepID=A0ABW7PBR6_9ACTN
MPEASLPAPMAMGVHGLLDPHPWVNPELDDVFALTVRRTVAYGWSSFHAAGPQGGRWDHNDAGGTLRQDGREPRVRQLAWMRVDVCDAPRGQRLPVLPMAAVLGDALHRTGRLSFTGLHTVAPLYAAPDSRADLAVAAEWFALADPAASFAFTVEVSAAESAGLPRRMPEILDAAREGAHGQVAVEPLGELSGSGPLAPGLGESPAGEPAPAGLRSGWSFRCAAREWSLDSAAWVTEIFADALRATGTTQPALITVSKPL